MYNEPEASRVSDRPPNQAPSSPRQKHKCQSGASLGREEEEEEEEKKIRSLHGRLVSLPNDSFRLFATGRKPNCKESLGDFTALLVT